MKGYLLLSDGTKLHGRVLGAKKSKMGEIVFHTGMTGYQEIVTDPSYYGQMVVLTYPMIGNYGVCTSSNQSSSVKVNALIVKEMHHGTEVTTESFLAYLEKEEITILEGIDTRYLTHLIRQGGNLIGQIVIDDGPKIEYSQPSVGVYAVSTHESYEIGKGSLKIAVLDFGIKRGILQALVDQGFYIKVFPASTSLKSIDAFQPDGVFLSNGPGDPSELKDIISEVKEILNKYPTFGICLGHQIIALAFGGETAKLPYGHRGSNHPVKNLVLDRVFITSQNHGYVVRENTNTRKHFDVTHIHVNDKSVEGFKHKRLPIFSVQYHPEAWPGPDDSNYLFDEFKTMVMNFKEVSHA